MRSNSRLEATRRSWKRPALLLSSLLTLACAAAHPASQPAEPELQTPDGRAIRPLTFVAEQKATVLLFISLDCPVSNSYAPRLAEMAMSFAERNTRLYFVYSDLDQTPADVAKHQADYSLPGPAVLDPQQQLAKRFGAKVTPQAIALRPDGSVFYAGAIDDGYLGVGKKRFTVRRHYLADAVDQFLAGQPVAVPSSQPVGCPLEY